MTTEERECLQGKGNGKRHKSWKVYGMFGRKKVKQFDYSIGFMLELVRSKPWKIGWGQSIKSLEYVTDNGELL